MARWIRWVVGILCVLVIVGAIYLPILRRRLRTAAKLQQQTAEQARRELTQAVPVNPGEPRVKAKLFWASGNGDGTLMDSTVELPLSSDPVLRSKQVLNTLLAGPVDADLRTLPPDAVLLAFYLLPTGTASADCSEPLAGHLDLTGTFLVNTKGVLGEPVATAPAAVPATPPNAEKPAAPAPTADKPAPTTTPSAKPSSPKSV